MDKALRAELLEGRKRIIAQLEEIEFRVKVGGDRKGGGPPAYGDVYAELEKELGEINVLLTSATEQTNSEESGPVRNRLLDWSVQGRGAKAMSGFQLALMGISILLIIIFALR